MLGYGVAVNCCIPAGEDCHVFYGFLLLKSLHRLSHSIVQSCIESCNAVHMLPNAA